MSNSKYDFHGLDNHDQEEEERGGEINYDQEQNFTREKEVLEDKTTVKTTVVSMGGSDIARGEELPEELAARLIKPPQTQDVSIFSCYQCNIANVKLLPIITEEQKRAYSCFRCISNDILDIHFEEFLNGNDTYIGVFHNYLDKQKA